MCMYYNQTRQLTKLLFSTSTLSSICKKSPPHKRFSVGCSSPFMRQAQNTSLRFALGANSDCLMRENQTCSVPALWGCEGRWSCDYGHDDVSTPPSPGAETLRKTMYLINEYLVRFSASRFPRLHTYPPSSPGM